MSSCGDSSAELMYLLSGALLLILMRLNFSSSQFSPFKFQDPGWEGLKGSMACLRYPSGVTSSDWGQSHLHVDLPGCCNTPPLTPGEGQFSKKTKQKWLWTDSQEMYASHTSVNGLVNKGWATYQWFILLSENMVCLSCFTKHQLLIFVWF